MLDVTIYIQTPEGLRASEPYEVDFVSLVNSSTYGAPPLIAPQKGEAAAQTDDGDKVLFINTDLVAAFKIEKDGE